MPNKNVFYFTCILLVGILIFLIKQSVSYPIPKTSQTSYFLSLADIHFDPFIACHDQSPCPLINKLRKAPISEWNNIFTAFDRAAPQFKQDTNYVLFKSALAAAKKLATAEHVRFVVVVGDTLGHNFDDKYRDASTDKSTASYQAFVNKTMQFITKELKNNFPDIDVYLVVGNNDTYQNDYVSTPNGKFFKAMSDIWSQLINEKNNRLTMQREFVYGGYYGLDIPNQKNLHLIVLNSVLFYRNAQGKNIDRAADEELNWLHKELTSVYAKNQRALILMHIPTGIDVFASLTQVSFSIVELWQTKYTERFENELKEFSPNVMAILPAHLHADWFQLLAPNNNIEKIPVIATPSISPIFGNNPAFKIFSFNNESLQLGDFVTYYYSIGHSSEWSREYDFSHIYNPACKKNCNLTDGMERLKPEGNLANQYKFYYSVSTKSAPIGTKWMPYYWCALRTVTPLEYQRCIAAI